MYYLQYNSGVCFIAWMCGGGYGDDYLTDKTHSNYLYFYEMGGPFHLWSRRMVMKWFIERGGHSSESYRYTSFYAF